MKDSMLLLAVTWMRVALPRMRIDQFLSFLQLTLLPLALINTFVVVAMVVTEYKGALIHNHWIGDLIGIATMAIGPFIVAFAHALKAE